MAILGFSYLDNLKKFWRRQKYQRLGDAKRDNNKRKIRIIRLGNKKKIVFLKMKQASIKLHWKLFSPLKLVTSFHNFYVSKMTSLEGSKKIGICGGKKVASGKPIPMLDFSTNDVVDCRMVLEIYKKKMSSRDLAYHSV
ncbi:hypothetical protein RND71_023975 [Anisodus tanguticus]|uniref:Uncharacterized protein n=1 Tax=Anisodus tanguticus TaxID=243964 RepID=A0AAE1RVF0_9SOLA|nr:hypothetical protein RND71_023975 [Anisodus tanguticus]